MRRDKLEINRAIGLSDIKDFLRNMLKEHHVTTLNSLNEAAEYIYYEALELVPIDTGALLKSIEVTVSKSPRYPGIIATAEAHNKNTGFDYALMQEVNDAYQHEEGKQAHFLEKPFREAVKKFIEEMGW